MRLLTLTAIFVFLFFPGCVTRYNQNYSEENRDYRGLLNVRVNTHYNTPPTGDITDELLKDGPPVTTSRKPNWRDLEEGYHPDRSQTCGCHCCK